MRTCSIFRQVNIYNYMYGVWKSIELLVKAQWRLFLFRDNRRVAQWELCIQIAEFMEQKKEFKGVELQG